MKGDVSHQKFRHTNVIKTCALSQGDVVSVCRQFPHRNHCLRIFLLQGKFFAASLLCNRSLDIRETALGPEHQDVAESLNNLTELLRAQVSLECSLFKLGTHHSGLQVFQRGRGTTAYFNSLFFFAGRVRECRSIVRAVPGHTRKGPRSRTSFCSGVAEQPGGAIETPGESQ